MQYRFEIKPKLEKKDPVMFKAVREKIKEIIKKPYRYKPLRYNLKGSRRVHLEKSFVLVFEIDEAEKTVRFLDMGHHDEIYRKKH